jgi:folate-binding protein YgfZ
MSPIEPTLPALLGAVRLADWGVIRATGEDARKFLHGQLTQDVEHLQPGRARLAGYCSPKGRLLATFVMWLPASDQVLLACSADLLGAVLKRLQMFVMRAKCKLSDASDELPLWGLAGTAALQAAGSPVDAMVWARQAPGEGAYGVRLADAVAFGTTVPRLLWVGGTPPALPELPADTWRWLEVMSGVPRVTQATSEQFVPQMVNLELVDGVNFQKGCYPGQEVVARSQYRGTLKRRAQVLLSPVALLPGQEVFNDTDPEQPAGMVVLAGSVPGGQHAALVELKLSALLGGALHAGAASGPQLSLASLPYAIPAEAA